MNVEAKERIELPEGIPEGFIVLRQVGGENVYKGLVEHSFSMDWHTDLVRLWWSGKAYSILGERLLDGREDAEELADDYRKKYPNDQFFVWDVRDPDMPVVLDWEPYLKNRKYRQSEDPKEQRRFDKFRDRNIYMAMKDE